MRLARPLLLLLCVRAVPGRSSERSGDGYKDAREHTSGRKCFKSQATRCYKEYEQCLLHSGPASHRPTLCRCQAEYYGVCLRAAGCSADYMLECIDMQRRSDCDDMSICGSSCVGNGNDEVPDSAVVLPVNNFGRNYLRFTVCERTYNKRSLSRHSTVGGACAALVLS